MKLILVDDNKNFREALRFFLEEKLHFEVIGEASNGKEFLEMDIIHCADIILMDILMDKTNGVLATKKILTKLSLLKIIAITMHTEEGIHLKLIESGFKGFVSKTDVFNSIEKAIQTVYDGKLFFPKTLNINMNSLNYDLI